MFKPNGRIWIDAEDKAFLGYGRIELLEKIEFLGSIRKAAAEMKMSYQQAWHLVEQMNQFPQGPLVISHRGGKGGGFAEVTPLGKAWIAYFKTFNADFQHFLTQYPPFTTP